ncbi:MAG: hypothetical protein FWC27_14940 [Firmicutes bacterium]|nr:hypothetical protein [Bacillota bacterium]
MATAKKRRHRALLLFLIPVVLLAAGFGLPRISLCPRCFSTDTAPIQYGYFPPDAQAIANHQVYPGGCEVELSAPTRHCFNCKNEFGLTLLPVYSIAAAVLSALVLAITFAVIFIVKKIRSRRNMHA